MRHTSLIKKEQITAYCHEFPSVYEDYPFHDPNWCVMRHKQTGKVFAWIFPKDGHIWVNVKCTPEWIRFWREAHASVVPAFHLNKDHWNSIILDGSVPDKDIRMMIADSYDLTDKKRKAADRRKP